MQSYSELGLNSSLRYFIPITDNIKNYVKPVSSHTRKCTLISIIKGKQKIILNYFWHCAENNGVTRCTRVYIDTRHHVFHL